MLFTLANLTTANTVASDPTTGTTVETIAREPAITTIVETEIAQAATTVEALAIKVVAPTTATDHPATTATDHPVTILIVEILLTIQTQPIQLLSSKTEVILLLLQPTQIQALDPVMIF